MLPDLQADAKGCAGCDAGCNARCRSKDEVTRYELSNNGTLKSNICTTVTNNVFTNSSEFGTIAMNDNNTAKLGHGAGADPAVQVDKPEQSATTNTRDPNPMSPALSAMRSPPRERIPGLTLLEMPERRARSELARSGPAALREPMSANDGYEGYDPQDLEDLYGIAPSPIPQKRMKSIAGVKRGRRRSEDEAPFLSLTDAHLSGAAIPHRAKGSQHDNLHNGA